MYFACIEFGKLYSVFSVNCNLTADFHFSRVRMQFNKDGNSYIHSDQDHDVHFTAFRISKLPTTTMMPDDK